ncbi:MAG: hypothetical protein QM718_14610 [Steroidobacteraceae bacterium]
MTLVGFSGLVATAAWAGVTATPQETAINGVWRMTTPSFAQLKDANGKAPPLNVAGQKLYDEHKAQLAKGDDSFDLSGERCKPMGFPRTLWDGSPFDMQVITGKQVFQGYTFNRNHRVFITWQDELPALQIPRYYGTSAAHWEGSTLVVKSALYNDNQLLDRSGLPLSGDMTLVERYIPKDGGRKMEVRLTITDKTYYTRPWDVAIAFERVAAGRIEEDVCELRSPFYKKLMGK